MKLNINKRKLLLLGGIGVTLLLTGCGKSKYKDKYKLYPVNNLNLEEDSVIGMVLDDGIDKNERKLIDKYSSSELISFYREASNHVVVSYINGYNDIGYRSIIKDYPKVVHLHQQYFDTYNDTNNETIKKLYFDIREFLSSDNTFEEEILANPIIMASQALYHEHPYSLMKEELINMNDEDVLKEAESKIKILKNK